MVIGGAAGALIALLFVSVSIRIDVLSASTDFCSRGAATLCLFMTVARRDPARRARAGGVGARAELFILAVALGRRARPAQPARDRSAQPISRVLAVVSPDLITTLLLAAAGVRVLAGVEDGIYVVIPAVIAAITGGVAGASLILIRITA